jgi:hypothetical protein
MTRRGVVHYLEPGRQWCTVRLLCGASGRFLAVTRHKLNVTCLRCLAWLRRREGMR